MTDIAYVNDRFLPIGEASVSVLDRGFLFGDGIYEVTAVLGGKLVDNETHLARLERSLREVKLESPVGFDQLIALQGEMIRRNNLQDGVVYIQITRGADGDRGFPFPKQAKPTLVMFCQAKNILSSPKAEKGVRVVSAPDLRWARRDIKSTSLLAQVLAKQHAADAGADETWMVEDGYVTEGASSSAFIITKSAEIITRPLSTDILPGCTRKAILRLAQEERLRVEERPFTVEEAYEAAEAFITSASNFVTAVVDLDGRAIGSGEPGPLVRKLRLLYIAFAKNEMA